MGVLWLFVLPLTVLYRLSGYSVTKFSQSRPYAKKNSCLCYVICFNSWGLPVIGVVFWFVVAMLRVSASQVLGDQARTWTMWSWWVMASCPQSTRISTWTNLMVLVFPSSCSRTTPNSRYIGCKKLWVAMAYLNFRSLSLLDIIQAIRSEITCYLTGEGFMVEAHYTYLRIIIYPPITHLSYKCNIFWSATTKHRYTTRI